MSYFSHFTIIFRFCCLIENNNLRSVSEIDRAGNIYIGQIDNNGKKQGHGVFIWAELGMIFDGQWKDNKKVGLGELKWSDGHWYKGEWKDDEQSGLGVMEWPNKQRYTGQFHIEVKKVTTTTFSIHNFLGNWLNNRKYGFGVQLYPDGRVYRGEWQDDLRAGSGILILPNGGKYEGQWWSDRKEGNGTYIDPNGKTVVGIWKNGKLETVVPYTI